MQYPIWKDVYYTTDRDNSPFAYSIEDNSGTTIFNGKAWVKPGEDKIYINVSKIVADYLQSSMVDLRYVTGYTSYVEEDSYKQFSIYDDSGNLLQTYNFLLDWSYEEKDFTQDINLSRPINGKYVKGMLFMTTYWESNDSLVHTTISTNPSDITWDGDNPYWDEQPCGNYALYYQNRYGGWDSFLIEGKVIKKDEYERYTTEQVYDNNSLDWGSKAYQNNITTYWEVHTGWLNDSQSDTLAFNLMSSNQVYIHDLATGEIAPAVLTDGESEYKTYKGNGRHMINYTINMKSSQTKQNKGC